MDIITYLNKKEIIINDIDTEMYLTHISDNTIRNIVQNIMYFEQKGVIIAELKYSCNKKIYDLQAVTNTNKIISLFGLNIDVLLRNMRREKVIV